MMRTLIFGTTYVHDDLSLWICNEWIRLHSKLNPEADLLLVDSASPVPLPLGVDVLQLGDNIGHRWKENYGKDGWGRAFDAGLRHAVREGYEVVACIEGDLLCKVPVQRLVHPMLSSGADIAAPRATPHQFIEAGLMVMTGRWLREFDLASKYDWENGTVFPEDRLGALVEDQILWLDDVKGARLTDCRERGHRIDISRLDYITHAAVPDFCEFLHTDCCT